MNTPVAFILFNRPDLTAQVFTAIRAAKPARLLAIADGARASVAGEAERCQAARAVLSAIDWPCQIQTNFSDINLGCRRRVATGLDWVFNQCEQAIILEDDCLPDPTFFRFADELLNRYRDDERIMMISGLNVAGQWKPDRQSYHFCYNGGIWGWASWRRAWKQYDVDMKAWNDPQVRERIRDVLADDAQFEHRRQIFDSTAAGEIDTWDYQWAFARLRNSGLSVIPATNLVRNIGFRGDATHTVTANEYYDTLPCTPMRFPLRPPAAIGPDRAFDSFQFDLNRPKQMSNARRRMLKILSPARKTAEFLSGVLHARPKVKSPSA